MSRDFKPGDEVVCVDNNGAPELERGGRYTIFSELPFDGVALFELDPPEEYLGFRASRFRKVERRNDRRNLTEWLAQPTEVEEPKRAPAKKRERVQ